MKFHVRMHNENVQYLKLPIIMIIITNATADLSVWAVERVHFACRCPKGAYACLHGRLKAVFARSNREFGDESLR